MSSNYDRPVFLELFLTPSEKDNFELWKEEIKDRSIMSNVLSPLLHLVASMVPANVAPNVITLAGSMAILQAWYFCEIYSDAHSDLVSMVCIASLGVFWVCGGIDSKHAKRTMNDTSMGELFKYVCDLISSVFLVVVMCTLLLEDSGSSNSLDIQWYCVQIVQIVLMLKHYSAFVREAGLRYMVIGPGELLSWAAGLLLIRSVLGLAWLRSIYDLFWNGAFIRFFKYLEIDQHQYIVAMSPSRLLFIFLFILTGIKLIIISPRKHSWTRNSMLAILALRGASGFVRIDVVQTATNRRDVLLDGLFMAMVTSDLIVAKMSGRELHVWVVLMASMVVMPHLQFLILCFVVFYYIAVFADLMNHMNMPLLQVCRNVYCDGIYDLCHIGHKNLFKRALKQGNRLFVGVVGDKDANAYKRPPVMTAAEREIEVAACRCVTKVIPNSPCFGLTEEFIKVHRIHVVAFGEEYQERFPNPDDDPYYKVPRKMGIAIPMPRTEGFSTSEIIKRIQSRAPDEKKTPGA